MQSPKGGERTPKLQRAARLLKPSIATTTTQLHEPSIASTRSRHQATEGPLPPGQMSGSSSSHSSPPGLATLMGNRRKLRRKLGGRLRAPTQRTGRHSWKRSVPIPLSHISLWKHARIRVEGLRFRRDSTQDSGLMSAQVAVALTHFHMASQSDTLGL